MSAQYPSNSLEYQAERKAAKLALERKLTKDALNLEKHIRAMQDVRSGPKGPDEPELTRDALLT